MITSQEAATSFQKILGNRFIPHTQAQDAYGDSTLDFPSQILFALQPSSKEEVVQIVRLAATLKIPLYPISTGNNWGYGSASPVSACAILDLSAMNRIVCFDEALGLLTLEPGVTHTQVRDYLQAHSLPYIAPVTGAGGNTSIVGNLLERGHSMGRKSDRFGSLMGIEAVLGNGSFYRSPFYEKKLFHFKWGIGPYLDGLFGQSNFGVVTEATVALAPKPQHTHLFAFAVKEKRLAHCVDSMNTLIKELGIDACVCTIQSAERLATHLTLHARNDSSGNMPPPTLQAIAEAFSLTDWFVIGTLNGNARLMGNMRSLVRTHLSSDSAWPILFLTSSMLSRIETLCKILVPKYFPLIQFLKRFLTNITEGTSDQHPGYLPYWKLMGRFSPEELARFRTQASWDPDEDPRCGLLFYASTMPLRGSTTEEILSLVRTTCRAHFIDPLISVGTFSELAFSLNVALLFDKQNAVEKKRAYDCYAALCETGNKNGFPLQRASIHAMKDLPGNNVFWETATTLKRALDPAGIISPGRYEANRKE